MSKLFIWDFDGVISDSLIECVTVAKVAEALLESPNTVITLSNLHRICSPQYIIPLYDQLKPLRPFIVKGQDYLWQHFNFEKFEDIPKSFSDYRERFKSIWSEDTDKVYEEAFYRARKLLANLMKEEYFALFRPYNGSIYAFRTSLKRHNNYVCTARDQKAVMLLFSENNIIFPREKILSKDYNGLEPNDGWSKAKQIRHILSMEGGNEQSFTIVEDQVKAPMDLKDECPNLSVVYAAYGYGLDEDWDNSGLKKIKKVIDPSKLIYAMM